MATIRVHTTQNVTLEYEVASIGDRIVATILDSLILGAWLAACFIIFGILKIQGEMMIGLLVVAGGIPYFFYNLISEVFFNGQSLGKRARDIRVVRLDGTAPQLGDYLLRWILRPIDIGLFSGLVAIITIAANGRGQRLGDLAAGTTVVKVRPVAPQAPVSAADLAAAASYQVVFPQTAQLADHDVALIRQLLQRASAQQDYLLLNEIANKIKALTGIQTDLEDFPFVQTVLKDHAHLTFNI